MTKLVLLTYHGAGPLGLGGIFALAGGFKATITARLNGAPLEVRGFSLGEGKLFEWGLNPRRLSPSEVPEGAYTYKKDPAFVRATGGYGTIPALLSEDGTIGCCESNAIARMVARSGTKAQLYGSTPWETAQIDMFVDKCLVFERDRGPWVDATVFGAAHGFSLSDAELTRHRDEAMKWLRAVDDRMAGRSFLVGDAISLADVVLACQMLVPWCVLLDGTMKAALASLDAHIKRLWRMDAFAEDLQPAIETLERSFPSAS